MSKPFATRGEEITCPDGHYIATFASDVSCDDMVLPQCFCDVRKEIADKFVTDEPIPDCPDCGKQWIGVMCTGNTTLYIDGKLR